MFIYNLQLNLYKMVDKNRGWVYDTDMRKEKAERSGGRIPQSACGCQPPFDKGANSRSGQLVLQGSETATPPSSAFREIGGCHLPFQGRS